ncbi:MAG: AIR synthase-related protein [Anaerolineae bacterium]|nr:AIR synthase-related protein [Anaerolineae bacterium]
MRFYPGVKEYAREWLFPAGANRNQQAFGPHIEFAPLFTPETSGGLLISVPEFEAQGLLHRLEEGGNMGWIIGEVAEEEGIEVV